MAATVASLDLVLTDLTMLRMGGVEMADRVSEIQRTLAETHSPDVLAFQDVLAFPGAHSRRAAWRIPGAPPGAKT